MFTIRSKTCTYINLKARFIVGLESSMPSVTVLLEQPEWSHSLHGISLEIQKIRSDIGTKQFTSHETFMKLFVTNMSKGLNP